MESPHSLARAHWDLEPGSSSYRSADFQSAVSRISNPQPLRYSRAEWTLHVLPTGSRRYGRLETCATPVGLWQSMKHPGKVSHFAGAAAAAAFVAEVEGAGAFVLAPPPHVDEAAEATIWSSGKGALAFKLNR